MNTQNVEKDDTAEVFARRYNLTIERLKELNPYHVDAIDRSLNGNNGRILDTQIAPTVRAPPSLPVKDHDSTTTFLDNARKQECDLKGLDPEAAVEKLKELNPDHIHEIERSKQSHAEIAAIKPTNDYLLKQIVDESLRGQPIILPEAETRFTGTGFQSKRKSPDPAARLLKGSKGTWSDFVTRYGVTLENFKVANADNLEGIALANDETKYPDLPYLNSDRRLIVPSPRVFEGDGIVDRLLGQVSTDIKQIEALNPNLTFSLKIRDDGERRPTGNLSLAGILTQYALVIEQLILFNANFADSLGEMNEKLNEEQKELKEQSKNKILESRIKGIKQLFVSALPKEYPATKGWSIDQVAAEFGISVQALIDANPDDLVNTELRRAASAQDTTILSRDGEPKKLEVGGIQVMEGCAGKTLTQDYLSQLNTTLADLAVLNDRIADFLILGKAIPPSVSRLVINKPKNPHIDYVNDGFEWLSYETVVNNPEFRRSNQQHEIPLYCVEMNQMLIWLREEISTDLIDALSEAFFPDVGRFRPKVISKYTWKWKNNHSVNFLYTRDNLRRAATRNQDVVVLEPRVVLPYNPHDNDVYSLALGTTRAHKSMRQLDDADGAHTWKLWKTASRSCVVELKSEKKIDDEWEDILKQPEQPAVEEGFQWPWEKGRKFRELMSDLEKNKSAFVELIRNGNDLKVSDLSSHHVSLKTGVCFVGTRNQSWQKPDGNKGDGKDAIDRNWIVSCLRSDFVALTNKLMKRDSRQGAILVLTELLTIAERTPRTNDNPGAESKQFQDGIQVRDLSQLDKTRIYIFPGSIPYLAPDYKSLTATRYESRHVIAWREFWRDAWAVPLGDAKARFLLQYGLQHKNPNPQNYLIELSKENDRPVLPARIVIRDLQDAAVHRESVWAFYGSPGEDVPTGHQELANAFKAAAERAGKDTPDRIMASSLHHEFGELPSDYVQETGTVEVAFGGPGLQVGWWAFSTGPEMNWEKGVQKGKALEIIREESGDVGREEILEMLGQWGLAHSVAQVRRIEAELGLEIRTIDWTRFPAHRRFPRNYRLSDKEIADNRTKHRDTEIDLAAAHEIQKILASKEGRDRIAEYRQKGWQAVNPLKSWKFVNHDNEPFIWSVIAFEKSEGDTVNKWWRPTDGSGTMPIFDRDEAVRAWWHTYDNLRTELFLEGNTWKPGEPKNQVAIGFVVSDGSTRKPIKDEELKAIWSYSVGGSHPIEGTPTEENTEWRRLLAGFYQWKVESGGKPTKFAFIGPTTEDIELIDGDAREPIEVEVEPLYTDVRFVAHALVTIPRQFYEENRWQARYVGKRTEIEDIDSRVEFLRSAITEAATALGDDDRHELKIYIVPECFFLGSFGAYQTANVEYLVKALQELVKGTQWKHWLFVFGTVNGTYSVETLNDAKIPEVFNFSPVIRGGWADKDPDGVRYTKLFQKTFFSAEMPSGAFLDKSGEPPAPDSGYAPTEKQPAENDRASKLLTEEDVRKGFGATENEARLGVLLQIMLNDPDLPQPSAFRPIDDWKEDTWNSEKAEINRALQQYGLTELIREIRRHNSDGENASLETQKNRRFINEMRFIPNLAKLMDGCESAPAWHKYNVELNLRKLLARDIPPKPAVGAMAGELSIDEWQNMKMVVNDKLRPGGQADLSQLHEVVRQIINTHEGVPDGQEFSFIAVLTELIDTLVTGSEDSDVHQARSTVIGEYSFRDFSFCCARKPGPIFELGSRGAEVPADQVITFGLEICADHSKQRAKMSAGAVPVDIHLVPSAGMGLSPPFIVAKDQGYAVNCDGWNAVSAVLKTINERGATVETTPLDKAGPEKGGINPLNPHSEVLKRSGESFTPVKPQRVELSIDAQEIFAYGCGVLHIYPPQKLPAS